MFRQVNVVNASRVQIHGVEPIGAAVNDFQPRALLNGQIDEQGPERQFAERLERHELVIRLRRPGVDFNAVLQGDDQELDALVLDDLEVYGALEVAHVYPAVPAFHLLQNKTPLSVIGVVLI